METCYRRVAENTACLCLKCRQGVLSKVQYTDQIRALCSQSQIPRRKRRENSVRAIRTSSRRTTNLSNVIRDRNRDFTKSVIGSSGFNAFEPQRYYIDEEQPDDLVSYNTMVNGTSCSADPRVLPAIVDTLEQLRTLYNQMLVQHSNGNHSLCNDREFNNNVWKGGSDSYSSDEMSSGEIAIGQKPQYSVHGSTRSIWPVDTNASNYNGIAHRPPYRGAKKRGKSIEVEKCAREAESKDSDSGVHFECNAFESKSYQNNRLHDAAREGDVEKMIHLILDCCDVNGLTVDGWPAIESALSHSKFRAALFLIEAGTDMNKYTDEKVDEYEKILRKARSYTRFIRTAV